MAAEEYGNMHYLAIIFLISLGVLAAPSAHAAILTKCGPSKGTSYYFPQQSTKGWVEDGISNGSMLLTQDGQSLDVIYTDAIGGTRSAKSDGFTVLRVPGGDAGKYLLVGLSSQGVVEHWLFDIDQRGNGIVVWGTIRGTGYVKSSLMKADCKAP